MRHDPEKGGAQESMRVTLAVTQYIGDVEPEDITVWIHK